MKKLRFVFAVISALMICGCRSAFEETVSASDLTIQQLEKRMQKAMDPNGRFAQAETCVMRQQISTDPGWLEPPEIQMVEVKFRRPDHFKLTTYTDNEAKNAIIASGGSGWLVDMERKKVITLDHQALQRVLAMVRLANPANRIEDVFEKVSIDRSRIDGEDFYRLTCVNGKNNPIYIYVDGREYLNRRMRMKFSGNGKSFDYDARMLAYSMYEGVKIPDESQIEQAGTLQKSKVIYYKLDVKLDDSEFQPPLF